MWLVVLGSSCCAGVLLCYAVFHDLQVSPEIGWVPIWRSPMIAVVVLVCSLFSLLLGAILVSNKLQSWLKVRSHQTLSLAPSH
jgi:branched-subunit amino acid ABC-type transport system permease component